MSELNKGLLIVVSGPSGVGKGTVDAALFEQVSNLCYSVSATTRQPRKGEVHGKSYFFLSKEEFLTRREQGDFLEWAEVYGNYYGTLRSEVERQLAEGKHVLLEIDTQGAMQIKAAYPSGVFVFILPPSLEELKRRIVARGSETEESLRTRLGKAEQEMQMADRYDYTIVNDDLQTAVKELKDIICSEVAKRSGC